MENKLRQYILYLQGQKSQVPTQENTQELKKELLVQIGFFQHERLIHLIVTVTFALLMMLAVLGCYLCPGLPFLMLSGLFLLLLIPYIRHYYILENGVQKLYEYYEQL